MRIGVFGGTFNPVHYGHLRAAEEACSALGLDKVIFVPSGIPPLKDEGLASAKDRFSMVELAVRDNPRFSVSDIESASEETSYTVDTLSRLADSEGEASLVFILGLDAFLELHLWKDPDALVSMADFAVLSRPGHDFSRLSDVPHARVPAESLDAISSGSLHRVDGELRGGRTLHLLRITDMEVSASMIRGLLRDGQSVRYLLPESVESFIMSHGLYGNRKTRSGR